MCSCRNSFMPCDQFQSLYYQCLPFGKGRCVGVYFWAAADVIKEGLCCQTNVKYRVYMCCTTQFVCKMTCEWGSNKTPPICKSLNPKNHIPKHPNGFVHMSKKFLLYTPLLQRSHCQVIILVCVWIHGNKINFSTKLILHN